ncbi:MAG: carbohydrate kinase family protein [Candidatus Nanoarchaeia archaeon]|nr:carbohydrate kinase family protein [Candidatus Haiyanarchaeum thermophilum]MCW1303090.1 carbohydrate kinase family protein [Candidatus Haiyanarchaeum thermophilum]MCW1303755.1 carbohydrate kinase family protein [Candidatus Haiyanarchaeum thermophilum]MCW1306630.1 carbohydrate kinase family protein [Candidatus Haiyanarchaeum thermophilum]MCW1307042.1 carbohydrate kinase family protein [Candidatus Haiyanarchaeum thermophilum]
MQLIDLVCIGDITLDIVSYPLRDFPKKEEEISTHEEIRFQIGGGAAIAACSASSLGLNTVLLGCVGRDWAGDFLLKQIGKWGVKCEVRRKEVSTAKSIIISFEDGLRSIINYAGANAHLALEDLNLSILRRTKNLLLSGVFHLKRLKRDLWKILKLAKQSGAHTFINLSTVRTGASYLSKCLSYIDFIFCTQRELHLLLKEISIPNVREVFRRYPITLVIHLGKKGAVLLSKDKLIRQKSIKVKSLNPVGSGDVFNSAFILAMHRGFSFDRALKFATASAVTYLMKPAQQFSNFEEVKNFEKNFNQI